MDYQKLDRATATAVQLRGEVAALLDKLKVMTNGDLFAKLKDLQTVTTNHANDMTELQKSANNAPNGIEQALNEM